MNNSNPLVSVIVPVYNHEKFIGKTIKSVMSQTYQNWELLVVDDCSIDRSWEIIQEYAKKDSRIRVFRNNQNMGLIPNWKFLLDNSRGDYIAFLEGDDFFCRDNVETKIRAFGKNLDVGMVYCDFDIVNEAGEIVMENYCRKNGVHVYKNEVIRPEEYLFSSLAPFSTYSQIMIRRNVLRISGYPRSLDEAAKVFLPSDWDFNFRVSTKNRVYFTDGSLLKYRKHTTNNSADMPTASQHYKLLFLEYEKNFCENGNVLRAIQYQWGKMHYLLALYHLENRRKSEAWREFERYVIGYPYNLFHDFTISLKLFIRLLLPNTLNKFIVKKYYGR